MKAIHGFILLTASLFSVGALANAVTPSTTGTVQGVQPGVTHGTVTVDGKTYTVTNQTKTDDGAGLPQPGQNVTLILAPDGQTVIAVHPASGNADSTIDSSNSTHP